jgi:hypothetical protein
MICTNLTNTQHILVVKVKVPRKRLENPEGARGIALHSLDLGARRGWLVSTMPRPLYPLERPSIHCTVGWVDPRADLEVCAKPRPTGIRSPDRPARRQSLYRLSYPGPSILVDIPHFQFYTHRNKNVKKGKYFTNAFN